MQGESAGRITNKQGQALVALARRTLEYRLLGGEAPGGTDDPQLLTQGASFVTLKIDGRLRGCIGNLEPVSSLWEGVGRNALSAAFDDGRFSPLGKKELADIELDVSVLSSPRRIHYSGTAELLEKIRPGIDGVILRHGGKGATFLPQVWQQLPQVKQFLEHLCIKANLAADTWKTTELEISIYQVQSFTEGL
jgi:AmmeMemoRadiSam system protein A